MITDGDIYRNIDSYNQKHKDFIRFLSLWLSDPVFRVAVAAQLFFVYVQQGDEGGFEWKLNALCLISYDLWLECGKLLAK